MSCFNPGHIVTKFEPVVRGESDTDEQFRARKNLEYDSDTVSRCATVVAGCEAHQVFRACPRCMFSHEDVNARTPLRSSCFNNDQHLLRHLAIIVWHTDLIWEFLTELNMSEERQRSLSWKEYFRMIVYQGQASVQNAFLLAEFFNRNVSRWRKERMESRF